VLVVVVEGGLHQPAQRRVRRQGIQVEIRFNHPDMIVAALENRPVQPLLAAEVVVNHPLDGMRALGNLIDAAAAEALLRELLGGNGENVRAGAVGIARGGGGHADRGTAGGSRGWSSSRS